MSPGPYSGFGEYRKAWEEADTLDPQRPLCVDLELSSACNLQCPACFHSAPEFLLKHKRDFMPKAMAMQVIDEAADNWVPSLKFNFRGEPTLHPDFAEIVEYAHYKDRFHDLLVNTNGMVPKAAMFGLMCATKVSVSVDSFDTDRNVAMRKPGNLAEATYLVNFLVSRGHENVWVRRVASKENAGEKFADRARELFGHQVHVAEHALFPRGPGDWAAPRGGDPSQWPRAYCGQPSRRVIVTTGGILLGCCVDWDEELSYGTFPECSLMGAWQSIARANRIRMLKYGEWPARVCRQCTSYSAYNLPERNLLKDIEGAEVLTA